MSRSRSGRTRNSPTADRAAKTKRRQKLDFLTATDGVSIGSVSRLRSYLRVLTPISICSGCSRSSSPPWNVWLIEGSPTFVQIVRLLGEAQRQDEIVLAFDRKRAVRHRLISIAWSSNSLAKIQLRAILTDGSSPFVQDLEAGQETRLARSDGPEIVATSFESPTWRGPGVWLHRSVPGKARRFVMFGKTQRISYCPTWKAPAFRWRVPR